MSAEVFALPVAVGWEAEAIFIREGSCDLPVSRRAGPVRGLSPPFAVFIATGTPVKPNRERFPFAKSSNRW